MPHIHLPEGVPGIRSLALYRPDTGAQLYQLVQVLLRGPSPLSPAERELIAAYVSKLNNCSFCTLSHAAAARCLYADETGLVTEVLNNPNTAPISQLMKRLLHIAGKVQVLGSQVQPADIEAARQAGATDAHLHDTVLIAAVFCMFNRYVDGLATLTPADEGTYAAMGQRMATIGYVTPTSS